MEEKKRKLFSDADFDKHLSIGDELVFDKQDLKKLRVELSWAGTDLDICAFMLGDDGMIHEKHDLVYFGSMLRWKTEKEFNDQKFNPLVGSISEWSKEMNNFKNQTKWKERTLPLSSDQSVIGSWDDMSDDEGEECEETMHVLIDEVDTRKYSTIVFAAAVAKERIKQGESFADAHGPVATVFNAETDEMVADYRLAEEFPGKDAVCFGKMEYDKESMLWSFVPMADAYNGGMQYLATEIFN